MNKVTLEEIDAKQVELSKLIAKFKSQQPRILTVPAITMELSEGEHYAGIIFDAEGKPTHHLILLPGERENIKWNDAADWAKMNDGSLPTRQEQALLYANLKGQFEDRAYWSSEAHASDSDYAWCQDFRVGHQGYITTSYELRARAVRRVNV